jgi:AcrR family transcriptional regulator
MHAPPLRKGETTRARILDAAYALFLEQGYHGTSMRQIADAAAITMGGIYNHFTGKEAIWEDVFAAKHPVREILPLLKETQAATVADVVRDAAARVLGALGHSPDYLKLMFIEIVEFNGKHVRDLINTAMPDILQLGRAFAEKEGAVRPLPAPLLARAFGGLIFSHYVTALFLPPELQPPDDDALDTLVEIFLHGILGAEGGGGRA